MTVIAKDVHRLIRRVGKLTDGQASVCDLDWEDGQVDSLSIEIRPNDGYYKGGVFKFKIVLPSDYEGDDPPEVFCETDIYHPNIDTTDIEYGPSSSNVCLNLLDSGTWNRKFGLEGAVLGLVFLLHNPNLSDPLAPDISQDEENFVENVKRYMRGEDVEGRTFTAEFLKELKAKNAKTETTDNTNEKVDNADIDDSVKNSDTGAKSTDNVDNGENNDHDKTNDSNDVKDHDTLLNELEKEGFVADSAADSELEECALLSFSDETVLISYNTAEILQEIDNNAQNDGITNPTSIELGQKNSETGETQHPLDQDNCEDDNYNSAKCIVNELVENAINICTNIEDCSEANELNFDSASANADTDSYENTMLINSNPQCDDMKLWKPNFHRQKSKEYEKRYNLFQTCACFLKCIVMHAFRCLTKL